MGTGSWRHLDWSTCRSNHFHLIGITYSPAEGLHDLIAAPEPTYREWGIAVEPAVRVRPDLPGWRSWFVVPTVSVAALVGLERTEPLSRSPHPDQLHREDRTELIAIKIRRAGPNTHPANS
jgi:hypothetical protein